MVWSYNRGGEVARAQRYAPDYPGLAIISDTNSETELPNEYNLGQNYPNPFNPSTKIDFVIPQKDFVTIKVYDLLGNEIAILLNEEREKGKHTVEFNSSQLSSGVYLYVINAGDFFSSKKMIFLK